MEETKMQGLVETFDTGELSTKLIPPDFTDPDLLFEVLNLPGTLIRIRRESQGNRT